MGIKDDAITYRQLRVFREVCAKGTVSRAGDDNGMKQSNVSQYCRLGSESGFAVV